MDQRGRVERVSRPLDAKPRVRDLAQLLVNQRQQLAQRLLVAVGGAGQQARDLVRGRPGWLLGQALLRERGQATLGGNATEVEPGSARTCPSARV
jgi:hypothetical protein